MRILLKNIFFILIFINIQQLFSNKYSILEDILPSKEVEYIVRLNNGDIMNGYVLEIINDTKNGKGIKLKKDFGIITVYENEIKEIKLKEEFYRHRHRAYILPTAIPIANDHFISNYELLFLYAGFGISDLISLTFGRSFIPGISSDQQISVVNGKITLFTTSFDTIAREVTLAVGSNLAFINNNNQFLHIYGVGTVKLSKTLLTANLFYKLSRGNVYDVSFYNNHYNIYLSDGSFGIGLGLDTELPNRKDLHIIGELWNSDVANPTNTAVLLGLRICNSSISSDFGLAFFTQPFIIPFFSFAWTPF